MLSENEKGTGVAASSVEVLLISLVIHLLSEKITSEQLDDYTAFTKSKEFKSVYMMAKEIMESVASIDKEHINTTMIFTAAMDKGNICIGFGSKEYLQSTYPKTTQIENNICIEHAHLDPKKLVEYSIISFGSAFNEFYNTETYLNLQEEYENTMKYYNIDISTTNKYLFIDMMNFLYIKILKVGKEAILYPNDEYITDNFFNQINRL